MGQSFMTAIASAVHGTVCVCVFVVCVCVFVCVCVCVFLVCVCVCFFLFVFLCVCVCVASKTAEGGWGKKMFAVKCVWCNSVKLLLFNFSWIQLSWIQLCLDSTFPGFSFAVSGCF